MTRIIVRAVDLKLGDTLLENGEVDWSIDEIFPRMTKDVSEFVPQDVHDAGGWVHVGGDDKDGYYVKYYGGKEEFNFFPDEEVLIERADAGDQSIVVDAHYRCDAYPSHMVVRHVHEGIVFVSRSVSFVLMPKEVTMSMTVDVFEKMIETHEIVRTYAI
jgi:hypothetical protein